MFCENFELRSRKITQQMSRVWPKNSSILLFIFLSIQTFVYLGDF